jgi:pantetheine-phosphate adenylyltransferase
MNQIKMIKGIYAGVFDPFTKGHLDIVKRSLSFCNQLVIAIGLNSAKTTMFTESERIKTN